MEVKTFDDLARNYFYIPMAGVFGLSALLTPLVTYRVVKHLGGGPSVSIMTSIQFGLRGILPAVILAAIAIGLMFLPIGNLILMIILAHVFVASPAAVTERLGPVASFSRAFQLTAGRRWGVFGLLFLVALVTNLFLKNYLDSLLEDGPRDLDALLTKASFVVCAVYAFYWTFLGVVQAVSYALLRQEKDGVTHEELARVFE